MNEALNNFHKAKEKAPFAIQTMTEESTCPYCGDTHQAVCLGGDEEEKWVCYACGGCYYVLYDADSFETSDYEDDGNYTKIIDVTDTHRISLVDWHEKIIEYGG